MASKEQQAAHWRHSQESRQRLDHNNVRAYLGSDVLLIYLSISK